MTEPVWAGQGDDDAVVRHVAALLGKPGPKTLALPGGATPLTAFRQLAAMALYWGDVVLLPTDDRCVPASDPASNIGALRAAFGRTGATLMPLAEAMPPPPLDLAWVGVGTDGHVASLFPNMDPSVSEPATVVRGMPDPLPPEAPFERLSLNLAAFARAREVIMVARGDQKRRLMAAAAKGENDLPVARLFAASSRPVRIFWSEA